MASNCTALCDALRSVCQLLHQINAADAGAVRDAMMIMKRYKGSSCKISIPAVNRQKHSNTVTRLAFNDFTRCDTDMRRQRVCPSVRPSVTLVYYSIVALRKLSYRAQMGSPHLICSVKRNGIEHWWFHSKYVFITQIQTTQGRIQDLEIGPRFVRGLGPPMGSTNNCANLTTIFRSHYTQNQTTLCLIRLFSKTVHAFFTFYVLFQSPKYMT